MASCCLCSKSILITVATKRKRQTPKRSRQIHEEIGILEHKQDDTLNIIETRCESGCRRFFHSSCFEKLLVQTNPRKCESDSGVAKQNKKCENTTAAWGNRQFWLSQPCSPPQASCHAKIFSVSLFSLTRTSSDAIASNMMKVRPKMTVL